MNRLHELLMEEQTAKVRAPPVSPEHANIN